MLKLHRRRSKENPREAKFRHAIYLLSLEEGDERRPPRRRLTLEEGKELCDAVFRGAAARFGLSKLVSVDLNERYSLRDGCTLAGFKVTLVEMAVLLGKRDAVLKQLLNARTNFLQPLEQDPVRGSICRSALDLIQTQPDSVKVWLCNHLVKMYAESVKELKRDITQCTMCGQSVSEFKGELGWRTRFRWPTCHHVFCTACCLESFVSDNGKLDFNTVRFQCPKCACVQPDDLPPEFSNHSPQQIKQDSLSAFLLLKDGSGAQSRDSKSKFRGRSPNQNARLYPGTLASTRQTKFWHAVAKNDVLRVRWLIQLGVSIDQVDEYGHSALFVACWRGFTSMVKTLIFCGAESKTTCNAGLTPFMIARIHGHDEICDFIHQEQEGETWSLATCTQYLNVTSNHKTSKQSVRLLIPKDSKHPGAGAFYIDHAVSENVLGVLDRLNENAPIASREKVSCSDRRYICDSIGSLVEALEDSVLAVMAPVIPHAFPFLRFLEYSFAGQYLPPHIDLARSDLDSGLRSSHTFILYLCDCHDGGETALLEHLPKEHAEGENSPDHIVISRVKPKRGRLLVFPHSCPHEGCVTSAEKKILLRGEFSFVNKSYGTIERGERNPIRQQL